MFTKILVPLDLGHLDRLRKALTVAAAEARVHGARVNYMGMTEETPGAVACTPEEYGGRLAAFAAEQASEHGIEADAMPIMGDLYRCGAGTGTVQL